MKITTLIENGNPDHPELACEHGLSLLIEADGLRILFDTGASGAFLDNARAMGIAPEPPDAVVISHAHFDHSGGVPRLLRECPGATRFFLGEGYFRQKYKLVPEGRRDIGTRFTAEMLTQAGARVEFVRGMRQLSAHLWLVSGFARSNGFEQLNPNFVLEETGTRPDDFADEVALVAETRQGLLVVAGCAHVGIVNLLTAVQQQFHAPIFGIVGGSHLVEADAARIAETVAAFRRLGVARCWLSHCTGQQAAAYLARECSDLYAENHTGDRIEC